MINALLNSEPKNSFSQLNTITEQIDVEHQRCIHSPQTALIHACNAGIKLIELRSQLSPQQWQHWLTTDCPLRPETAQVYMQMATKCSAFPKILSSSRIASNSHLVRFPRQPHVTDTPKNPIDKSHQNSSQTVRFSPVNHPLEKPSKQTTSTSHTPTTPSSQKQPFINSPPIETLSEPTVEPPPEAVIDVDFVPTSPDPSSSSKTDVIRFCLAGNVVPKARPRVTRNGTHLPQRYRAWRNQAEVELYRQMCEMHPTPKFPLQKAAISLRFFGNHRTNSDIDNLAGACLDALTLNGAGILKDDRLSCLPQLSVEFVPGTPETGVWIEIEPLV
ncbi:MAG: RusA family crossover junction endodeoxyribonuclease [Microcoleaceae cyanobacterium]